MAVYNVTEALVKVVFNESFVQRDVLPCKCERCKDDILAYAMNRLPSRYVSTDEGNAYVKAQYLNPQLQSDILRELAIAVDVVGKKPRHDVHG
jgi:competence protein ComFB